MRVGPHTAVRCKGARGPDLHRASHEAGGAKTASRPPAPLPHAIFSPNHRVPSWDELREDCMCNSRQDEAQRPQSGVYAVTPREELQKTLHHRAHLLEDQARGLRRLAEIVGVAGSSDRELFAALRAMIGPGG